MGLVNETEVDGVRTFWVDSGRPTLAATLMFRVGQADETLPTSGWLHLLEHLALHGLPGGTLAVNGSVGLLTTTFTMHGPPEQVVAALAEVTRRLTDPDFSELDRERRVLAAEAATRGGPVQRAFGMRYGAQGPGLASYDDLGLGRASAEQLSDLARRAFGAGNATLALDGPPPEPMTLHLGHGDLWPVAPATQVEKSRTCYADGAGLFLSGLVERSGAGMLVAPVVEDALRRRLRDQEGAAYSPFSLYEAVDVEHALVLAGSDVSPTLAPSLLGWMIDLTDDLATNGPDPQAYADVVASAKQGMTDPYNVGFLSHRAAAGALRGRPLQQLDEVVAELEAEDVESVRGALVAFRDSLIVGVPPTTAPHTRLPVIEQPASGVAAKGSRSRDWPADGTRLAITDSMVTFGDHTGQVQFPLGEIAGYLRWDDGSRRLILHDGWTFALLPDVWRNGERHARRLDDAVPGHLHLPQPAETALTPNPREPLARRWWLGLNRWYGGPIQSVVVLVVLAWCLYAMGQGMRDGEYVLALVFPAAWFGAAWFFATPKS